MRNQIDNLVDSFTNGNRAGAIDNILAMPKAQACVITAYVHDLLSDYHKAVFTRMLEARMEDNA